MTSRVIKGKCRFLQEIGLGTVFPIYMAMNLTTGEVVALKMMHAEPAGEGWFSRRFRREAKLLEKLDTPYAVRLLDYGEEGLNFHPGVRPRPQAGSGIERRKGNGGGAVAGGEF